MLASILQLAVLSTTLLGGLPWLRASSAAPREPEAEATTRPAASPAPNRVVLLANDSPGYRALAIPRSYKTAPNAELHLLVFRDGLCVRDRGLLTAHETASDASAGTTVMVETGIAERASVASDERNAVVASTRYVSRVDVTPGTTSTAGDTVKSTTTLTLVDPLHPDGLWQVALENGRWVSDMLVLPASMGMAATTFLPRTGPNDLRILDAAGHETLHVPESFGAIIGLAASEDGRYVAAEIAFPDDDASPFERGVIVFDVAHGTQWTYGWRYGSNDEPTSWTLQNGGVLAIKSILGTRRFDPTGRRL